MRAVVTRVLKAEVVIGKETYSNTGEGLLVLVGSQSGDSEKDLEYIADKIMNLRIFEDDMGKMNRSILDRGGEIMLVSQFTLLGDARKGRRSPWTMISLQTSYMVEHSAADHKRLGFCLENIFP